MDLYLKGGKHTIRRPLGSTDAFGRTETPRTSTPHIAVRISCLSHHKPNDFNPRGKPANHSPSKDQVDRAMRALTSKRQRAVSRAFRFDGAQTHRQTLEQALETWEVGNKPIDQRVSRGRSEVGPQVVRRDRSAITEGICDVWESCGVLPSESVGGGVGELEVRKTSIGELVIVIGVTPSTKPSLRGSVAEDCRIRKVCAGVYESTTEHQHGRRPCTDQLTLRPVPVGQSSFIVALGLHRILKVVDVCAVPRQEKPSVVNLSDERPK